MTRSVLCLLAVCASLTASDVAYREQFPDGPNAAAAGWKFNHSAQGLNGSKDDCWGGAPGAKADAAVESDPDDDSALWKGFVWLANGDRYLFWTEERGFKAGTIEKVTWRLAGKDPEGKVHLALRVNGAWYASASPVVPDNKPIPEADEVSVEFSKATWIPFTWSEAQSMPKKLDETAAKLPGGDITAFGFLATSKHETHCYDNVTVITTRGAADVIQAKK